MLFIDVVLALGLALLLVIGAWSTSHGTADTHTTVCLASGVSSSSPAHDHGGAVASASPDDAAPVDSGVVVIAALCCFLLVLLLRRLPAGGGLLRTGAPTSTVTPVRAGPLRTVPALSLTQLCLSRT